MDLNASDLTVALASAVLGAGIAIGIYVLESRQGRTERREEYYLDSAGDLGDRISQRLQLLRPLVLANTPYVEVRAVAAPLLLGLRGQMPRYRRAGVEMVAEYAEAWFGSFLGSYASNQGKARAQRHFMEQNPGKLPWTSEQVANAADDANKQMLDELERVLVACFDELAAYDTTKGRLVIQEPDESWSDLDDILRRAALDKPPQR